jgi:hypothetical protein
MSKQEDFIKIDEIENLIDNLEMASHFLETYFPYKWKWVIIALHQALYGALISTLRGTDARQTVVDRKGNKGKAMTLHIDRIPIDVIASKLGKNEAEILDWISNPYLISLKEALRRVKRKDCLPPLYNAQPLITTAEEDYAIERLTDEFRNEFEHFVPKGWIIPTSIMSPIVSNVLRVIRFLEFESNCVHISLEQEQRIKTALVKIEHLLSS